MLRTSLSDPADDGVDPEALLEALSSEASRKIIASCAELDRPVKEICDRTGLSVATAYRHVNDLVDDGILERSRSAISPEGNRYDLFRFRLGEVKLSVDGEGVILEWDDREDGDPENGSSTGSNGSGRRRVQVDRSDAGT